MVAPGCHKKASGWYLIYRREQWEVQSKGATCWEPVLGRYLIRGREQENSWSAQGSREREHLLRVYDVL